MQPPRATSLGNVIRRPWNNRKPQIQECSHTSSTSKCKGESRPARNYDDSRTSANRTECSQIDRQSDGTGVSEINYVPHLHALHHDDTSFGDYTLWVWPEFSNNAGTDICQILVSFRAHQDPLDR